MSQRKIVNHQILIVQKNSLLESLPLIHAPSPKTDHAPNSPKFSPFSKGPPSLAIHSLYIPDQYIGIYLYYYWKSMPCGCILIMMLPREKLGLAPIKRNPFLLVRDGERMKMFGIQSTFFPLVHPSQPAPTTPHSILSTYSP